MYSTLRNTTPACPAFQLLVSAASRLLSHARPADEEVAAPVAAALHVHGDAVRVGAARQGGVGAANAVVVHHGAVHVGLQADVAHVGSLHPAARGLEAAAHLVLGLLRIGEGGVDLTAGLHNRRTYSQAFGTEEGGRIVAYPLAQNGDPPIEITVGRLLVELELHGHLILLAVKAACRVEKHTGEDGAIVLDPALVLGIVAAFVVAIQRVVVVVGVKGEEMG